MRVFEDELKGHRSDFPLRALWNNVIAGIVFDHKAVERWRRERRRDGALQCPDFMWYTFSSVRKYDLYVLLYV